MGKPRARILEKPPLKTGSETAVDAWYHPVPERRTRPLPLCGGATGNEYSVLCLSGGDPPRHWYQECHRVVAHDLTQGDQDTRLVFPNEEAARKLLYLALRNASKKWQTIQNWTDALNPLPSSGRGGFRCPAYSPPLPF